VSGRAHLVSRVDAALADFLSHRAVELESIGPDLRPLAEAARSLVLDGGKRLRPMFTYWGWRTTASADDDDAAIITAAASLELLHACALVHDDVMDGSATRRGRPAAHAAFAAMHRRDGFTGDAGVFGTAAAIVLGDLLLTWADAMFAAADVGWPARAVYDEMRQQVMAGQYLDALVQARGRFLAEDALRVIEYKTSKYTIEGPLLLGASAAGASDAVIASLSAYGLALGEAFQLRDDVLGVFGDPGVTGKPAGDDLREGKRTLLVALAMQRATPVQAGLLTASLGDRALDDAGVEALRAVIVSTGALNAVEDRIAVRAGEARDVVDAAAVSAESRAVLHELAVAATVRHT
jgi:geranylgeranyl diphosphate synthase, type I